jgi:fermentation-respiration switch protein FrsA (DUF1100 family)
MILQPVVREILLFILLGILFYLAYALYLYANQTNLIHLPYIPTKEVGVTPHQIGLEFENISLLTDDEVKLHGWFIPHTNPRATLLFFHGNAGNISHRLDSISLFNKLALSILVIDYRGYGRSKGTPSESGIYRDAEAAWRYLTEVRGIPEKKILLFGRSLGGAVAAYLATRYTALGVVLESTFTSIPDLAAEHYPLLPVRWLAQIFYDTSSRISAIHYPIMIIHSRNDEIIPFSHGLQLFNLANEQRRFLELTGSHNYGFTQNIDTYMNSWDDFILYCQRFVY